MVSQVVENKIVKLSIDDASLTKGLQKAVTGLKGLDTGVKNVKFDNFDKGGKSAMTLGERLGNLVSKIPIVGNLAKSILGIGKSSDESGNRVGALSGGFTGLISRIPIIGNVAGAVLGIGKSALTSAEQIAQMGGSNFSGIESGANSASTAVSGVGTSASNAGGGFNILAGAAAVALGGIAQQAISTGATMLKHLTVEPIMAGFKDYEEELESTRILTSALGKEATPAIKESMRDLEDYAGTTRYNVQQMNSSLAQFVNAGVGLKDANVAIKGWGNLAASAGASTQQFGASLQFGVQQALQMGKMTAQNWMSVENANMATEKFKNTLMDVGKELGENVPEDMSMFRESLQEGWITNEVLIESLKRLSEDKSMQELAENVYTFGEAMEVIQEGTVNGWSRVWRAIIGEGEDAVNIWSPLAENLGNAFTAPAVAVEKIAIAFNKLNGRAALIQVVVNAWTSMRRIMDQIGLAWQRVFPNAAVNTAKGLVGILNSLAEKFKMSTQTARTFGSVFELIFRIMKVGFTVIGAVARVLEFLIPDNMISNILLLIGAVSDIINLFVRMGAVILDAIIPGKQLNDIFNAASGSMTKFWNGITKWLEEATGKIKAFSFTAPKMLKDAIDAIMGKGLSGDEPKWLSFLANATKKVQEFVTFVKESFSNLFGGKDNKTKMPELDFDMSGFLQKGKDIGMAILSGVGLVISGLGLLVINGLGMISPKVKEWGDNLFENIFDSKKFKNFNPFASTKVSADELSPSLDNTSERFRRLQENAEKTNKSLKDTVKETGVSKDSFDKFKMSLDENISKLGGLKGTITTIKELGSAITETVSGKVSSAVGGSIKRFQDGFVGISTSANDMKSKLWQLGDFIRTKLGVDMQDAAEVVEDLKDRFEEFKKGPLDSIKEFFGNLKDALENIDFSSKAAMIKSGLELIGQWFETLGNKFKSFSKPFSIFFIQASEMISTFMKGLSLQDLNSVLQTWMLWKMFDRLAGSKTIIDKFKDSLQGLKEMLMPWTKEKSWLDELRTSLKAYNRGVNAKAIKDIAAALLLLSGAMFVMSLIPADKVNQVLLLLVTAATAIAVVYTIVKKFQNNDVGGGFEGLLDRLGLPELKKTIKQIGQATIMMALATSIIAVGTFMLQIKDLSWEEIGKGLTAAGVAMLELALISRVAGKGAKMGDAAKILALAYSLKMIIGLIEEVNKISESDIQSGIGRLTKIALLLGMAIALMGGKVSIGGIKLEWGKVNMGTAATILALTHSIKQLTGLIDEISKFSEEQISTGLYVIKSLAKTITAAIALMGGEVDSPIGKIEWGKVSLRSSVAIIALTLGIKTLAGVIEQLSSIDRAGLINAENVIFDLAIIISLAVMLMGLNFEGLGVKLSVKPSLKSAFMLIAIVGGIWLIAKEIEKLSQISAEDLDKGKNTIMVIAGTIGLLAMAVGNFANMSWSDTGGLVVTIAGLILVSGTLMKLTEYDWNSIKQSMIALAVVAGLMAGLMLVANFTGSLSTIGTMAVAALVMYQIGETLGKVASLQNINKARDTVTQIVFALAIFMGASALFGNPMTIVTMLAATVALYGISAALTMLANVPSGQLVVGVAAMTVALTALVAAAILITYSGAIVGLAALALTALSFGAAALMFGMGAKLVVESLWSLYTLLITILPQLQGFFSGIGEWISNAFSSIGEFFSNLWTSITEAWNEFWSDLGSWGSKISTALGDGIGSAKQAVVDKAKSVWDSAKKKWEDAVGTAKGIGSKIGGSVSSGIGSMISSAKQAGSNIWNSAKGVWDSAVGTAKNIGSNISNKWSNGISSAKQVASNAGKSVWNGVKNALSSMSGLWDSGKAIVDKWVGGLMSAFSGAAEKVSGWVGKIRGLFPNSPAKWGPLSGSGWTRLRTSGIAFVDQWQSGLDEGFDGLMTGLGSTVGEIAKTVADVANMDYNEFNITPVIRPELDMEAIESINPSVLSTKLGVVEAGINVDYAKLNTQTNNAYNQNTTLDNVIDGMNIINNKLNELVGVNMEQTDAIQQGKYIINQMDSTIVNKALAPGMIQAQKDYTTTKNMLGGIQPSL